MLHVSPASADERPAALRIYFQHIAAPARESHCDRALALIAHGDLPAEGLLVCRAAEKIVGAITALPMAGAAALIWPPQVVAEVDAVPIEDALIQTATAWVHQHGAKFAQALLPAHELPYAGPLLRHDYQHITSLLHLQQTLSNHPPARRPAGLRCETYINCDQQLFDEILLASYEGTFDCPELNDLRTAQEIREGYLAMPGSRLDRWWLAWHGKKPVGVLIMMPAAEPPAWEMAYVGLTPPARRKGIGRALTHMAMAQSKADGADRMTLTVDARNQPARHMYATMGFEQFDSREVFLTVFRAG